MAEKVNASVAKARNWASSLVGHESIGTGKGYVIDLISHITALQNKLADTHIQLIQANAKVARLTSLLNQHHIPLPGDHDARS
jgi:hypothetical protein